jgi:UDP-N-acetylglucosamine 2-epimerase (non-hydrolysing)
MERFERVLLRERPDLVLVVGDVNSTLACALVASKLQIKVAHVEAGLRSFDRNMPEEINRVLVDHLSDLLFTTCEEANKNLLREGIDRNKICFVGNVMIDTLLLNLDRIKKGKLQILAQGREDPIPEPRRGDYAVVTLHRPSNVDKRDVFEEIAKALEKVAEYIPTVFPIHPRTKRQIDRFNLRRYFNNVRLTAPLGYLDFLRLCSRAKFVITDSGGIQEETTFLRIPCLTLRKNTERPITITQGTNYLVDRSRRKLIERVKEILNGKVKKVRIPKYWDGKSAERIVKILKERQREIEQRLRA